jgi:hypothetical protein
MRFELFNSDYNEESISHFEKNNRKAENQKLKIQYIVERFPLKI